MTPEIPTPLQDALADRYEILRELGQGGMATVYLARDLKHNRQVALKVLRPELAAVVGADRFLAEIQTTANLQHPHILPLFDSGEASTFVYYVMPYVEGESLRERLDREHQLPIGEGVRIASNLASALDYAHRKGVIHRDIKPANILMQDGQPVLADFGIALAVGAAGGARLTETGLSLGTPYYMSPEQATGDQTIGPSSDIYAVGCVLYEMLVGDPPFTGSTAQAVLGKILATGAVAPKEQRPAIPANVDAAIRKSLEKLPADRFPTADEMNRALGDSGFRHGDTAEAGEGIGGGSAGFWKPLALVATVVAVLALGLPFLGGDDDGANGVRDLGLPFDAPLEMGFHPGFAVSPDGSFVIYEARAGGSTQLWRRETVGQTAEPIRGTEGALGTPRISSDGGRVAFIAGGEVKVVDLETESVSVVAQTIDASGGGWTEDGLITFVDRDGQIFRWIDPETGPVRELEVGYCFMGRLMPGSEALMCGGGGNKLASFRPLESPLDFEYWYAESRAGGDLVPVDGSDFRIVDDEYVVYLSLDGTLMGTRIVDLENRRMGRSVSLLPGIRRESYTGSGQFDVARDGTLVYVPGVNAEEGPMVRVSLQGDVSILPMEPAAFYRFSVSPDGNSLAAVVDGIQGHELRVYDMAGGSYEMVDRGSNISYPSWSPDGRALYYIRIPEPGADDLVVLELNSARGPQVIIPGDPALDYTTADFIGRDSILLGAWSDSDFQSGVLDLSGDDPVVHPLGFRAGFVALSPDGRWLAYQEEGGGGLSVLSWPGLDRRYLVDSRGGDPLWISSTELAYWTAISEGVSSQGGVFYRVAVGPDGPAPAADRELIITDPRFADTPGRSFAIANDGDLIYKHAPSENLGYYFRAIPGWVDEMKRRVDEANP